MKEPDIGLHPLFIALQRLQQFRNFLPCFKAAFRPTYSCLLLIVLFCMCSGCVKGMKPLDLADYKIMTQTAKGVIPLAVDLERLYPTTDHFIEHYGDMNRQTCTWNTVSYFGGRYELEVAVEVEVDYEKKQIIRQVGALKAYLLDSVRVVPMNGGGVAVSYGKNYELTEAQLKAVLDADGDYSVVNIVLNTNAIDHFDEHIKAARRDRIPVSLLDK